MESDPQLHNSNSTAGVAAFAVGFGAATTTIPSSKICQLAETLKVEHQFLRVPFEHYKKTVRANHRVVEKEVSDVISGVSEAMDSDLSRDDAILQLNSLVSRLQGLKRKIILGSYGSKRTDHTLSGLRFKLGLRTGNDSVPLESLQGLQLKLLRYLKVHILDTFSACTLYLDTILGSGFLCL